MVTIADIGKGALLSAHCQLDTEGQFFLDSPAALSAC